MGRNVSLTHLLIVAFGWLTISAGYPKTYPALKKNNPITIMTYNVHHCNPPETAGRIDVDAIAAAIKSEHADLVAVQEVDVNTNRSGKINQANLLAEKAGYPHYYFGKAMDYDGGQYGVLILSQYPLSDTQTHQLPKATAANDEPRVLAVATVVLPGGKAIRFGSTHLEAYNKSSRILQVREICRLSENTSLPFIVAGDFNAGEKSEEIRMIDEQFSRTCSNCPPTFQEEGATGAIDYILYRPKNTFQVLSHRVIQNHKDSDHMPVIAKLQFK